MLNYIDKLRIAATFLVFCLHSLLFTGKNFPMMDMLKDSGGTLYFLLRHGVECGYFLY